MEPMTSGLFTALVLRTAIVLLALVVGFRVFGKGRAGEMNVYDLLLVLMAANAVQNAMTESNGHLLTAVAAAGTLLGLGWLYGVVAARRPSWKAKLMGGPTVIAHEGKLIKANAKREGVTEREIATELRNHGLTAIEGAKLVVLEADGSLTVVPKDHEAGGGGGGRER